MGSKEYIKVMEDDVKLWLAADYPKDNYVWQQDRAPGHTSKLTQTWCANNLANFWQKDKWPPSSPDLNPLDSTIWSEVERKACRTPPPP